MAAVSAGPTGGPIRGIFRRPSVVGTLPLLSFVVYACTVFALPQVRNARYSVELSSIAAAVSNVRYGAPLGSLYSGVLDYFIEHLFEPLKQTLEPRTLATRLPVTPPSELFKTTRDGSGTPTRLV
jgi:hypothetical protein